MNENINIGEGTNVNHPRFKLYYEKPSIVKTTVTHLVELPLNEYVGISVRLKRNLCGLKQQELADKAKMLRTTLSHIENGRVKISIEQLYIFCQIFNCKSSDLLPF